MTRIVLCILVLAPVAVFAQDDSLLCTTELHLGLGAQKFFHFGGRYHVGKGFLVEGDLGVAPITKTPHSYTVGVAFAPEPTLHTSDVFYSLLYTVATSALFKSNQSFIRLMSINVGVLSQHREGASYQLRVGAGIGQDNLIRQIGSTQYRDISYFFWGNIEISVGYAFY